MPLRRLDDKEPYPWREPCKNPEHKPPAHIVLKPGRYEHTCPACKIKTYFTVPEQNWRPLNEPTEGK